MRNLRVNRPQGTNSSVRLAVTAWPGCHTGGIADPSLPLGMACCLSVHPISGPPDRDDVARRLRIVVETLA
jgi:hypothetical protein